MVWGSGQELCSAAPHVTKLLGLAGARGQPALPALLTLNQELRQQHHTPEFIFSF